MAAAAAAPEGALLAQHDQLQQRGGLLQQMEELAYEVLQQLAGSAPDAENPLNLQFMDLALNCTWNPARERIEPFAENDPRVVWSTIRHPNHQGLLLAKLLRVLEILYASQREGRIMTLRELFYHDKELFLTQDTSTRMVHILCCMFRCTRAQLLIDGCEDGFFLGSRVRLTRGRHSTMCELKTLIPRQLGEGISMDLRAVRLVLIVEKDTVFQRLQTVAPRQRWLLVTGRGMPSVATRQFLHNIHQHYPALPFFGLFDADPYGELRRLSLSLIDRRTHSARTGEPFRGVGILKRPGIGEAIFRCYKFGSRTWCLEAGPLLRLESIGESGPGCVRPQAAGIDVLSTRRPQSR